MNHMLSTLMLVWSAGAAAADCPDPATRMELRWLDRRLDGFAPGSYVGPERAANVLHDIKRIENVTDPACLPSLAQRLAAARRRATEVLKASLEADSFVLEGNIALFERRLDGLEGRVAAAEAAGWPDGSKGALATEYVGYYQGQRPELMRMYIALAKSAFRAEEADESRPWVEETTCEAGRAIVRVTPRVRRLEEKLGVAYDMPGATPHIRPGRRFEDGAGPIFGHKAFDGPLPVFDGGGTFVTGGGLKDIRTPPPQLDIPPPGRPRGWMR